MGVLGIEPKTCELKAQRSTTELYARSIDCRKWRMKGIEPLSTISQTVALPLGYIRHNYNLLATGIEPARVWQQLLRLSCLPFHQASKNTFFISTQVKQN